MNLDDPRLTAYGLNELTEEERAALERELRANPIARARLEATLRIAARLERELRDESAPALLESPRPLVPHGYRTPPATRRASTRVVRSTLAAAACLAIAGGAALWALDRSTSEFPASEPGDEPLVATSHGVPDQRAVTDPLRSAQPASVLASAPGSFNGLFADPPEIDLGPVPTGVPVTATLRLVNGGSVARTIEQAEGNCGCTVPDIDHVRGRPIPPGEYAEVTVELTPPPGTASMPIYKLVTFTIEGQRELRVPVKAYAVSYVRITPEEFDPGGMTDGCAMLHAIDEQPFRIVGMDPPLIDDFDPTPRARHDVTIPLDLWPQRAGVVTFHLDHPECPKVIARLSRHPVLAAAETAPRDPEPSLIDAARRGDAARLQSILARGAPIDVRGHGGATALMRAARGGHVEIVRMLIDAGAAVNLADNRGMTPLMYAAQSRSSEPVRMLLDAGAAVNARDRFGGSALLWAAGPLGDVDAVQTLLAAGADARIVDEMGMTPLMWAAGYGDSPRVRLLVDASVVDAVGGPHDMTAALYAASRCTPESVRMLLDAGASVHVEDALQRSMLDLAGTCTQDTQTQIMGMVHDALDRDQSLRGR